MNTLLKRRFSVFIILFSCRLYAANCCGGGFALPSLITGDDKAQITGSISQSRVTADVSSEGVWYRREYNDSSQIYKLEAAHIVADRFQVGISLPILFKSREVNNSQENNSGLSDISASLGYEFLPDWNYNPYRPKGLGYLTLTLPTGKSIYESSDGLDSRGRGFLAVGAGALFTKTWTKFDALAGIEMHRSFSKVVNINGEYGNINPGFGSSLNVGAGYSRGAYRLGTSVIWTQEDGVTTDGAVQSTAEEQKYASGSLSLSYLTANLSAFSLTYSDQTLFGTPNNTTLSQSVTLSYQKRWAR